MRSWPAPVVAFPAVSAAGFGKDAEDAAKADVVRSTPPSFVRTLKGDRPDAPGGDRSVLRTDNPSVHARMAEKAAGDPHAR